MEIDIMSNDSKFKKNKVLGRGLSALIPQSPEQQPGKDESESNPGVLNSVSADKKDENDDMKKEAEEENSENITASSNQEQILPVEIQYGSAEQNFPDETGETEKERTVFFNSKTGRYEERITEKKFKTGEVTVVSGRRAGSTASLVIPNPLIDAGTIKESRPSTSVEFRNNLSGQYYKQDLYNTAEIATNLKDFVRREIQNHTKVISNIVQGEIERLHYLEKKMQLPKDVEQINSLLEKMQAGIDKIESEMRTEMQEAKVHLQAAMEHFCEDILKKVSLQNNIDDRLDTFAIQMKNEMRGEIRNRMEEMTKSIQDLSRKVASRERQILELRAEIVGINEYLKTINSTQRNNQQS
jgi:prefoldin subunit 5